MKQEKAQTRSILFLCFVVVILLIAYVSLCICLQPDNISLVCSSQWRSGFENVVLLRITWEI